MHWFWDIELNILSIIGTHGDSGTTVDWGYIPGSADCCDATMPRPFCRKAVIWIVTHTLAFAIGVQLSIVMLWGISFWHDGKLVVIVDVIIIILQLVGSGQGRSVGGYAAKTCTHACTHVHTNKRKSSDLCWEWRQSLVSSSLFCDESLNDRW